MKKRILFNFIGGYNISLLLVLLLIFGFQNVLSQVQNNGTIYVSNNASLYTSGDFSFGIGSITKTNRGTGANHGKLIFGAAATVSGTSSNGLFVDGFASTKKTGVFELPTGDGTTYAPITVNNGILTNGVDAVYKHATPTTLGTGLGSTVTALLGTGYWTVKGDNTTITLQWISDISTLSADISNLIVVGYNNTSSKWEEITSSAATGATSSGSVSTVSAVTLSSYVAYTIGSKGTSCPAVFAGTGTKIWTGSAWSPAGVPSLSDAVTLNGNYPGATSEGSFVCNSLAMGDFTITLTGQQSVEVVNDVTSGTNGKIIMSSETSFVQRKPTGTAPKIELTKTTRPIKRYDYVYWGSPLSENSFTQLPDAVATGQTIAGAFDLKYKYVSGIAGTTGGWQDLTLTERGRGFIMRVKEQAPFIDATSIQSINLKFTGIANNGTIAVPVGFTSGLSARNNNLLSNPYPSAIDADKFLTQNSSIIDGAIYLWRANTTNVAGTANYAVGDYIAYTKAGSTAFNGTSSSNSVSFSGKIASGQGFKVRALAQGDVEFNNCMRVSGQNTEFFRTDNAYAFSENGPKNRFNLNLISSEGIVSQILVAYLPETTLDYDYMYDAEMLSVSSTKLYSILDNGTQKLAINARPPFISSDEVAIGFLKSSSDNEQLSIDIALTEGVFAENQTPVYLYDNQLNLYHNFANGSYTFSATNQEENNRFKIVYTAPLSNDNFTANTAYATLLNNTLEVSATSDIKNVNVFDITGRLVVTTNPSGSLKNISTPFHKAAGVYIINIELTNGQTISQKLIQK